MERVTAFWSRYGRIVLAALGVLAAGVAILVFTLRARAAAEGQAAGRLAEANIHFWQGDYERSLEIARQVIQQYGSTPSGLDAHRIAGDDAFWLGDYQGAAGHYRRYLERARTGMMADAVRRSLAYVLESDGQLAEAATLYESLVGRFDRESSAEFLMAAARCQHALGRTPEATVLLQRLVNDFGEASLADRARERLAEVQAASR